MKRILIALAVVAGLILAFVLIAPQLVSEEAVRQRIESTLEDRLARPVDLGAVSFGFRPAPRIRAEGLHLGPAPGKDQEIRVQTLDLRLALLPLLRREVKVTRLDVDGLEARVTLRPDTASIGSSTAARSPETGGAGAPPAGTGFDIAIDSFRLRNGRVEVRRGDAPWLLLSGLEEDLRARVSADGKLALSGTTRVGAWSLETPAGSFGRQMPASLEKSLQYDPSTKLLTVAEAVLDVGGLPLSMEGEVENLDPERTRLALTFAGGPTEIENLLGVLPSSVLADVEGLASSGRLQASGRAEGIVGPEEIPDFELRISLSEGKISGPALPASIDALAASLRIDPGRIEIESLEAAAGSSRFSLKGTIDAYRETPALDLLIDGDVDLGLVSALQASSESTASRPELTGRAVVRGVLRGTPPAADQRDPLATLQPVATIELHDVAVRTPDLPEPVENVSARMRIDADRLVVESLESRAGSSTLRAKGSVDDLRGARRLDLAVAGDLDLALVSAIQSRQLAKARAADPTAAASTAPPPQLSGRAQFEGVVRGTLPVGADPRETLEPLGTVVLADAAVRDIEHPVEAMKGTLAVRGRELSAKELVFRIEESDFECNGWVSDYFALVPPAVEGGAPARAAGTWIPPDRARADVQLLSRKLDLDAFAPPPAGDGTAPARSANDVAPTGFELFSAILSRLEGPLRVQAHEVRLKEVVWQSLQGSGRMDRGRIEVDALSANVFGGKFGAHGSVDLRSPRSPRFDLELQADDVQSGRVLSESPNLGKLSGLGGFLEGAVDLSAVATGALGEDFQLDLRTLTSQGNLQMAGARITGHPVQTALATYLAQSDIGSLPIHDWLQPFRVRDGRVEFDQLLVRAGDFTLSGSGWTSIDGKIEIDLDLLVPESRARSLRQKLPPGAAQLLFGSAGEPVLVPLRVAGETTRPAVSLDESRVTSRARERAEEKLQAEKEKLEEALESERDALEQKLEDEAKKRVGDVVGGLLPGRAGSDSTGAGADSVASGIEEEVKGILKGLFQRE